MALTIGQKARRSLALNVEHVRTYAELTGDHNPLHFDEACIATWPQLPRLSKQPWPDRDAIPMDQYLKTWKTHHGYSSISLITARGCPFTCTWCSHSVFGETRRC